jgi:hypothetical protein
MTGWQSAPLPLATRSRPRSTLSWCRSSEFPFRTKSFGANFFPEFSQKNSSNFTEQSDIDGQIKKINVSKKHFKINS